MQEVVAFPGVGISHASARMHINGLVVRGDVVPFAIALAPGSCLAGGLRLCLLVLLPTIH
jgi:hypothetical protein